MEAQLRSPRSRRRGASIIEVVLLAPWIFMLFIGALDWGFYASALISVQAAARSAALYTSGGTSVAADSATACTIVLDELQKLPNIGTSTTTCGSNPVVTAEYLTSGPDGAPATKISVQYQSISLIPLPGLLTKQFTLTRTVTMRVRT
jgi:Flp pilus assembly protein TadG